MFYNFSVILKYYVDIEMFSPIINRILHGFIKEYPGLIALTMSSTISTFIIDSVVTPRLLGSTFKDVSNAKDLRSNLTKLVLTWILSQVGNGLTDYCFAKVDIKICSYLNKHIFHKLFLKYEHDHQNISIAKLMDTIDLLQNTLESMLYRFLSVFPRFIILFIILVNLYTINPKLGMYTAVILLLFIIMILIQYQSRTTVSYPMMDSKIKYLEHVDDVFVNMERVSSVHEAMKKEEENCTRLNSEYTNQKWNSSKSVLRNQFKNYAINIVIFSFILYQLFRSYQAKEISNDEVVTFLLSVSPLFVNMYDIIFYMPEFTRYFGILSYHTDFMTELFSHEEHSGKDVHLNSNEITFENVSYSYKDNPVLTNVSLTIPSGSFITLRGPSGIGKSTLFKLLSRNLSPSEGLIKVDGHDISELSISCIRKNLLCLNQHSTLFNNTVYNNMIYGEDDSPILRTKVENLIREHHWTSLFPDKDNFSSLDANVGHLGNKLSGGQRQLVHLIRCFLTSSPILLLDEPTSAIDSMNTKEIMDFIGLINRQGKTILLISHEDDVFSDKILDFKTMAITSSV